LRRHLTDLQMEGMFVAQSEEDRDALRHIAGCAQCRERFEEIGRRMEATAGSRAPGETAAALGPRNLALAVLLARQWREAPARLVELLQTRPADRELMIRREPRFHTWSLLDLLTERSRETAAENPEGAEELGRLALVVADQLDAVLYGAGPLEDLRARAWALVGNARRVRSDLKGADEAFRVAREHLARGSGDLLERATIDDLEASLRRGQGRSEEATSLLHQAIDVFRSLGELHRAGRSLVNLSVVHCYRGELDSAVSLIREALTLLDGEREPRVFLNTRHNLAFYLAGAGRFEEAMEAYHEAVPLYRDFPDPWVQNRRRWVRGRILRGLGRRGTAEKLLLQARDGFVAEGIPYDTALVSLELATLYAEQGRTADLKRLAEEMVPIFASLQIHREALAALAMLKQAMEREEASLELVTAVSDYLQRARFAPELPFER
jgi:tetratricopeptide (TPR) repeat protein